MGYSPHIPCCREEYFPLLPYRVSLNFIPSFPIKVLEKIPTKPGWWLCVWKSLWFPIPAHMAPIFPTPFPLPTIWRGGSSSPPKNWKLNIVISI